MNITLGAAIVAMAGAMIGIGTHKGTELSRENEDFKEAKAAVALVARDPGSLQFRNLRRGASPTSVCGEVNWKNGFGGYTGFETFSYEATIGDLTIPALDRGLPMEAMRKRIYTAVCGVDAKT